MTTVPNTTPETLGSGAIVKFSGNCTVFAMLVKGDASMDMGAIVPNGIFTATVPGDYEFTSASDCCHEVTYEVLYAGEGEGGITLTDNGDGTGSIAAPGQPDLNVCTECTVPVTYTYSDPDENGVITIVASDGSPDQTITLPPDNDAVTTAVVDDELVFYDADGAEIPSLAQDLSQFISSPHPTITGANDAVITEDADGNYVVSFIDTDTDTTYTIVGGNLVGSDGTSVPLPIDTDTNVISSLVANADGSYTHQNVDANGNPIGNPVTIRPPLQHNKQLDVIGFTSSPNGTPADTVLHTSTYTSLYPKSDIEIDVDASMLVFGSREPGDLDLTSSVNLTALVSVNGTPYTILQLASKFVDGGKGEAIVSPETDFRAHPHENQGKKLLDQQWPAGTVFTVDLRIDIIWIRNQAGVDYPAATSGVQVKNGNILFSEHEDL